MKELKISLLILIFIVYPLNNVISQAYSKSKSSQIWIDGTSTMHDWKCQVNGVASTFIIPENIWDSKAGESVKMNAILNIPVNKISHKDEDLVENLRDAMESDEFPQIKYELQSASIISKDETKLQLKTQGKLKIHGVEKNIGFDIAINKKPNSIMINGVCPLKMTDFGIKPPSMFLGTIKTGNEVKIGFELDLSK